MTRQWKTLALPLSLAILVAMATGCAGPAAAPTETQLTALEIIDRSSEKFQGINSFHFVLDQVGGGTPIAVGVAMNGAVGDVAKPDRLKMTVSGTAVGMFIEVQLISVGEVAYMTNPLTGKWELVPIGFRALSVFDPNTGIAAIMRGMANLTKLDDEEVDGVLGYHLGGSIDSGDLGSITGSYVEGVTIDAEIWIGKEDFVVRLIKLEGKITESEVPGIVRTLKLSNFDEGVSIELPE
ncbi:MAG: LppX_LprAFG lipoprotein [Dehalococcoidales bacterium]